MSLEQTLPALIVKVEGKVLETNIDAYRNTALEYVESINTALNTDDDFAGAEGVVKWGAYTSRCRKQHHYALSVPVLYPPSRYSAVSSASP